MSGKTAWASKASSLPSDRIAPRNAKPKANSRTGSVTPSGAATPRKSPEVRRLEDFRDKLAGLVSSRTVPVKDPQGGCFCQARTHPLSKYTPACSSCGLPLCSLNLPTFSCPSCRAALLSPSALQSLLATVEDDLQAVLQKEEDERRRVIEEHKRIEGGFPTLGAAAAAAASSSAGDASGRIDSPQPQSYKVLSLTGNGKKKKPIVSTYTKKPKPSPQSSLPASRSESPSGFDTPERRVPPPPAEVVAPRVFAQKAENRPWMNCREEVTYVRAH